MNDTRPKSCLSMLAPVPYGWRLHSRTRALADEFARRGVHVRYVAPPTPRAMLRHWVAPWRERRAGEVELIWPLPVPALHWQQRLGLVDAIARRQAARIWGQLRASRKAAGRSATPVGEYSECAPQVVVAATPLWRPVVAHMPCDLLVYDCLDDPLVHARVSSGAIYLRWHEELCRCADVLVAVSTALAERLRGVTDRPVVVCGNGVDARAFGAAASGGSVDDSAAGCQASLRNWFGWRGAHPDQPVAGFLGSIDRWVDVELLAALARSLPGVQVVVAGPERHRGLAGPLAGIPNVRRIGLVPYAAVPALMRSFDVGLIPFKAGAIAAAADPLKVYEYAAAGKPVVCSVRLRLDDADAPVTTAETAEGFVNAVSNAAALGDDSTAERERRMAFARRHTWAARAKQFLEVIEQACAGAARAMP
jgi:glycosyltransferase involved in cell wall biosynthesis